VDALSAQQLGVDRGQMPALVHDEDRPGGRDTVEMVPVEALTGEEDRVQAPCAQRLTGLEPSLGLLQAGDDLVEARAAGPHRPAGVLAGIVADVGLRPEPTAVGMGM